jgi:hypothetical protein
LKARLGVRPDDHSFPVTDDETRSANEQPKEGDRQSLSPELALVDPAAAEHGRQTLPGIVLTEDAMHATRGEPQMQPTREDEAWTDEQAIEEIRQTFTGTGSAARRTRRRRRRFLRPRVLVPLSAILVVAVVVAIRTTGHEGGAKPRSAAPAANPTNITPSSSASKEKPAARSIPDFVWVPVKGATRYRVQFLRSGRVVLTTTTNGARLHVASAKLPPGTYRWKVWALTKAGTPAGAAVVDASAKIR